MGSSDGSGGDPGGVGFWVSCFAFSVFFFFGGGIVCDSLLWFRGLFPGLGSRMLGVRDGSGSGSVHVPDPCVFFWHQ